MAKLYKAITRKRLARRRKEERMSGVGEQWPHELTAIGVPASWFVRVDCVVLPSAVIPPDPGQATGMLQVWMAPNADGAILSRVERAVDENRG